MINKFTNIIQSKTIILIGDGCSKRTFYYCQKYSLGRMITQTWPQLYDGELWGFDNGAYGYYKKNLPFDDRKFFHRIEKAINKYNTKPLLAVAPDIVAGGRRSLEFTLNYIDKLPNEWNWYLALQDGMIGKDIIECIDKFSGLFLGGTIEFKKTAKYWKDIAKKYKKKFHYARAGTLPRMIHASLIESDSFDTTYPLYEKTRLHSFIQELHQLHFIKENHYAL